MELLKEILLNSLEKENLHVLVSNSYLRERLNANLQSAIKEIKRLILDTEIDNTAQMQGIISTIESLGNN